MINFVEDLPEEWKKIWLKIKEESGKSYNDDLGEQIIFMYSQSYYLYM